MLDAYRYFVLISICLVLRDGNPTLAEPLRQRRTLSLKNVSVRDRPFTLQNWAFMRFTLNMPLILVLADDRQKTRPKP
jgi:hypothetical protein